MMHLCVPHNLIVLLFTKSCHPACRTHGSFSDRENNIRFLMVLRSKKLINFYNALSVNSRWHFCKEAMSFYDATRTEKRFRLAARDMSTHFRWSAKKLLMEFRRENDGRPPALCKSSRPTLPRAYNCSRHDRASLLAEAHQHTFSGAWLNVQTYGLFNNIFTERTSSFQKATFLAFKKKRNIINREFYTWVRIAFCLHSDSNSDTYIIGSELQEIDWRGIKVSCLISGWT